MKTNSNSEIVLNTLNAIQTSEYEVANSLQKLDELAKNGVISADEYTRRSNLIMEFMEVEGVEEEIEFDNDRSLQIPYGFELINISFFDCLRDCFLGRYEVD